MILYMLQQLINTKLGLVHLIIQFLTLMVPKVYLFTISQSKIWISYRIYKNQYKITMNLDMNRSFCNNKIKKIDENDYFYNLDALLYAVIIV